MAGERLIRIPYALFAFPMCALALPRAVNEEICLRLVVLRKIAHARYDTRALKCTFFISDACMGLIGVWQNKIFLIFS